MPLAKPRAAIRSADVLRDARARDNRDRRAVVAYAVTIVLLSTAYVTLLTLGVAYLPWSAPTGFLLVALSLAFVTAMAFARRLLRHI
jgi:hypothetical protein